jgi:hypothetical protein
MCTAVSLDRTGLTAFLLIGVINATTRSQAKKESHEGGTKG